jgi:predicted HTH domain antitoxin
MDTTTLLEEELTAVTEAGLYASKEAFLEEAVAALLESRSDLRELIACRFYEKGIFSLGRAAEWARLSIEELKESLHRQGIVRQSTAALDEIDAMARRSLAAAGRAAR